MNTYYIQDLHTKREVLLKSKAFAPFLSALIADANKARMAKCPLLTMDEFNLYYETGNRLIFEEKYFARRRYLSDLMMALWLTDDDKSYLEPMLFYIDQICDEFTWCLPAHADLPNRTEQEAIEFVDLFQAETARLFAEIMMCVEQKLPENTKNRTKMEIHRRIFASFNRGVSYWWETCKMNWATVCGAGCAMAFLTFGSAQEMQKYLPRFQNCLDSYLEGIAEDGCCQEGMAYWSYGFSHFLMLAQVLFVHSAGKINYFTHPKAHALALFPQRIRLSGGKVAAFSDSHETFSFKIGILSFLKEKYPDVLLPDLSLGTRKGNVDSVSELLWFNENYTPDKLPEQTEYLADSGWYIARKKTYSFAAKGGHNDEPHNHNDIGAFMVTQDDETIIADLGCGEYVKETFLPETRYAFLQNASRGHSVPIINGVLQQEGANFVAKNANLTENGFSVDLENAYPDCGLTRLHRQFTLGETSVKLTDEFSFSNTENTITERFITKLVPTIERGTIHIGSAKLQFDTNCYRVNITTEQYTAHNSTEQVTVYLIDLSAKTAASHTFTCTLTFD